MKKFFLFLLLTIAMGTTAMAQLDFSNEKVYTLVTTRGWLIYNPDNEAFVASTASYTDFAVSEGNANCQWAIHKSKNGKPCHQAPKGCNLHKEWQKTHCKVIQSYI